MSTAYSLLPDEPPPPGSVFAGKVSRVSPLQVTLEAYGDTHEWPGGKESVTWLSGASPAPARGARVLVLVDDLGGLWAFGAPA